jgi:hypothetical protein
MKRTLLFLLPETFKGENRGLYVQHVASMEWLLAESPWQVETVNSLSPALEAAALAADLVIVQMLPNSEAEAVIRARRSAGRPTVFEITDNVLDLGPWLDSRHVLRNPLVRQNILYHAWLCDALQVYAQPLAQLFNLVNPRIGVFDPYVPLARPKPAAPEGPFVVGWAGTGSHAEDLARIAPAIVGFCRREPGAIFAYMGDLDLFRSCFAGIDPAQTDVRPFGSYDTYLEFVRTWDLGLAPLGASGFNSARTDTKFATYAACQVAALIEKHPVHEPHKGRALLFDSVEGLGAMLDRLKLNRAEARDLARRAHAWASRERALERLREQRLDFFESLLAAQGRDRPEASEALTLEEALAASPVRRLRTGHRSWASRADYFRAVLEVQPFDYIALTNLVDLERRNGAEDEALAGLFERLCLLAPEAVPPHCRPANLHRFLPNAA